MSWVHALLPDRWHGIAPQAQNRLRGLAAVAGILALWLVLLAPAWRTLQDAPRRHQALDRQLEKMQRLHVTLTRLRDQPPASPASRVQALEGTLRSLGPGARLSVSGTQLTLTLKQIPAGALADWLVQSRVQTGMEAIEARLTRQTQGAPVVWDGVLVYRLPVRDSARE
jgi:general secretion pathway protein M